MKKLLIGVCFTILTLFLLVGCTYEENTVVDDNSDSVDLSKKVCLKNNDCVQASCCHATDVINRENAPDCKGVMCTQVCEPNTLDCGQGQKKCLDGICVAVLE